jgi:hypothetical protein
LYRVKGRSRPGGLAVQGQETSREQEKVCVNMKQTIQRTREEGSVMKEAEEKVPL